MKPTYQPPSIEVIEVTPEGIIAASTENMPNENWGSQAIIPTGMESITSINPENQA